jgi:hypothetical protein
LSLGGILTVSKAIPSLARVVKLANVDTYVVMRIFPNGRLPLVHPINIGT